MKGADCIRFRDILHVAPQIRETVDENTRAHPSPRGGLT